MLGALGLGGDAAGWARKSEAEIAEALANAPDPAAETLTGSPLAAAALADLAGVVASDVPSAIHAASEPAAAIPTSGGRGLAIAVVVALVLGVVAVGAYFAFG